MDIFEEIAAERRALADLLEGLTPQERTAQSLCREWRVHDVAAHLIVPLEVGVGRFTMTMLACASSFDRAAHRFTPPGAGPEAPLTDVLVHGIDIRRPVGVERQIPAERAQTSLTFLTTAAKGLVVDGALEGLRSRRRTWAGATATVLRSGAAPRRC